MERESGVGPTVDGRPPNTGSGAAAPTGRGTIGMRVSVGIANIGEPRDRGPKFVSPGREIATPSAHPHPRQTRGR
jgi:hypothetical protein